MSLFTLLLNTEELFFFVANFRRLWIICLLAIIIQNVLYEEKADINECELR